MYKTFKELKQFHEDFLMSLVEEKNRTGGEISTQIVFSIKGKVIANVLTGEDIRMSIKDMIVRLSRQPLDWLIIFNEGYAGVAKKEDDLSNFQHGTLEQRFKAGDKSVRETVILQIYTKSEKCMVVFDKLDMKKVHDSSDFSGFLTVSDVRRVMWSDWHGYDPSGRPLYG